MFSKDDAASAMLERIEAFEDRSRLFEDCGLDPDKAINFLGNPEIKKLAGDNATSGLLDSARKAVSKRCEVMELEWFVSLADGRMEILLPVRHKKPYGELQQDLVYYSVEIAEGLGDVRVREYKGLVNIMAKITRPEKLSRAVMSLGTAPHSLEAAGIVYNIHINYRPMNGNHAHTAENKKRAPKPQRASEKLRRGELMSRVLSYLENNKTIDIGALVELGAANIKSASECLRYYKKTGILDHTPAKGVYEKCDARAEAPAGGNGTPPAKYAAVTEVQAPKILAMPASSYRERTATKRYDAPPGSELDEDGRLNALINYFIDKGGTRYRCNLGDAVDAVPEMTAKELNDLAKAGYFDIVNRRTGLVAMTPAALEWQKTYNPKAIM